VDNCSFGANVAAVNGAGIFQEATPGSLTNSTFRGNRAQVLALRGGWRHACCAGLDLM
jgi:hypothetical protein